MYRQEALMTLQISVSDFRKDLKKYSELVRENDILVLSNGRPVMRITDPMKNRVDTVRKLKGILGTEDDYEEVLQERMKEL